MVNHPTHYGGERNVYEAIKVIEAYNLGFNLGNVIKYVLRSEKKGAEIQDLEKALWYLSREIENKKKFNKNLKNEKKDPVVPNFVPSPSWEL